MNLLGSFGSEPLVDALVLILHDNNPEFKQLVLDVVDKFESNKPKVRFADDDVSANEFLEFLIRDIIEQNVNIKSDVDLNSYLLKFKTNPRIVKDPDLFTTLRNLFLDSKDLEGTRKTAIVHRLSNYTLIDDALRIVKDSYNYLNKHKYDEASQDYILANALETCSSVVEKIKNRKVYGEEKDEIKKVDTIDFSNADDLEAALDVFETVSVKNNFKTGLQGINDSLGGGFAQGSSIVFAAPSYSAKSLMLMKMARWCVTLNKVDSVQEPTCLFFSLENETHQNLMQIFKDLYVNEYKQLPPDDFPRQSLKKYIADRLKVNGWNLYMIRKLGSEFGFEEFVDIFRSFEKMGKTPVMVIIDYVNLMAKGNGGGAHRDETGVNNLQIQKLYNNLCNFTKSHNCTLVTAHQLNRSASVFKKQNPIGAVRKFTEDMLADSISVKREVDILFYMNIEEDSAGNKYLAFRMDKHRYVNSTPEKYKCFSYPFFGELGILDDIDGLKMCTDNVLGYDYQNNMAIATGSLPPPSPVETQATSQPNTQPANSDEQPLDPMVAKLFE